MKIYDCFTFYNELDLLEIRLNELDSVVDYFVIVEATKTQTGLPKKLYFDENKDRYCKFFKKIIHIIVNNMPDIKKNNSWVLEEYQRNQIIRGLTKCHNNDIIFISDLDELPNKENYPSIISRLNIKEKSFQKMCSDINAILLKFFNRFVTPGLSYKSKLFRKINRIIEKIIPNKRIIELKQKWYYYYLNGDAQHSAINTRVCTYKTLLKDLDGEPHNIRNIFSGNIINSGWHFSYLGGMQNIKTKLKSLADYEKISKTILNNNLMTKINTNKALIINKNVPITFVKIDNTFPKYIQYNKEKYKKIIVQGSYL